MATRNFITKDYSIPRCFFLFSTQVRIKLSNISPIKATQIPNVSPLPPPALSDKNGAGIGLTLGICVAFIGLIFDNLIRTWVEKRKKHLGIA